MGLLVRESEAVVRARPRTSKVKSTRKIPPSKKRPAEVALRWQGLEPGSLVDVVAPASKCPRHELEAGVRVLESWGLKVRVPENLFSENLLHSANEKERWQQLKAALTAKDSRAIWCVRGGYGSMKLLPMLERLKRPANPKIFIGLSDLTSLLVFFNQRWHWPVLHAPLLSRVGRGDLPATSIEELKHVLFGEQRALEYTLAPLNSAAEKCKKLSAPLVGGNWATMMASLSTPYQISPAGCLLFLEDVGERGYKLDRFWEQLAQMGFWNNIAGIIFGDFTEGDEPNGTNIMWDVLKTRAVGLKKPVFCGIPAGHGSIQRVLPLGPSMKITKQGEVLVGRMETGIR